MKFFEKLNNKTLKDSSLILSGNLISQIVSMFVTIIVSRSLSVIDYALYSILNNISSFVTDMADMGMNSAITKFVAEYRLKGEIKKENQLIRYALKRKLINLIIVFFVLTIGARPIAAHWLHDDTLFFCVYLVIVTTAFSLFVTALRAVLQGRQEFKKYFITVVTWSFIWCGSIMFIEAIGRLTIFSSVLSSALSGSINLVLCIYLVHLNIHESIPFIKIDKCVKKKFNNFGYWMLLWALFAILQSKLDVFMLATFTTSEEVSYYDIAAKMTKPILMLISSYAQVLNPQFASIPKLKIRKKINSIIKPTILISIGIVACIFLVEPIIQIIFGHKYDMAIFPARLLFIAILFYVWTVPFNSALYALDKAYIFTLAAFIGLIVTAIGDYLLLSDYGAIGAAITYIIAQIVGFSVAYGSYITISIREKL